MKKAVSLFLCMLLTLGTLPSALAYDGAPAWAREAYDRLEELRILPASGAESEGSISRGAFAAMLVDTMRNVAAAEELTSWPACPADHFADAPSGEELYLAAAWGILDGTIKNDGGRYADADLPLTREQAAKMVCSALDFFTEKLGYEVTPSGSPAVYQDAASISPWAAPFTGRIASYSLMQGDQAGNFNPLAELDWPSAVVLVSRTLSLMEPAAQDGTGAAISRLTLRSGLDWSGALNFGANDWSASRPKTGYAMGYYTIDNGDGTVSGLVVPSTQSDLQVETYGADGSVIASKTLPRELPIFGAFFAGQNYNYVAFGQTNASHTDSQEVWRIVQYDKAWNRVGAVSATGGETYTSEPFRSTVSRMAESADWGSLILYSARTRYDGHQSNITFVMDTQPFRISELMGQTFPSNHVSHSFGQFVQYDGDRVVTVDHGDAYPRSFVLQTLDRSIRVELLKFIGEIGDNATNAIGSGFEVSDSGYLFLGCSKAQEYGSSKPWEAFLAYTDKDGSGISFTWLSDSAYSIKRARLVKLDGDTFVALYSTDIGDYFYYQVLNGSGERVGDEQLVEGVPMPPTQPIVQGGSIRWISSSGSSDAVLYTLDIGQ